MAVGSNPRIPIRTSKVANSPPPEMDVDSKQTLTATQRALKKKIEKRKKMKSRIVFPKYKDRKTKGRK